MKVRYKNESWFMRLLGLLTFPFNQLFMDKVTTTIGSTIYFPGIHFVRDNYKNAARILAHESVHIFDKKRDGFMFFVKYLMPQALFLPVLIVFAVLGGWIAVGTLLVGLVIAYVALAMSESWFDDDKRALVFCLLAGSSVAGFLLVSVLTTGWLTLLAGASLLCLAPWPSPWRAGYEYRGYAMGIAISVWQYGDYRDTTLLRRAKTFTGFQYYRMAAREHVVIERLYAIRQSAKDGSILQGPTAEPYRRVYDVYRTTGNTASGVINA